jgi:hypothetical protein
MGKRRVGFVEMRTPACVEHRFLLSARGDIQNERIRMTLNPRNIFLIIIAEIDHGFLLA